MKYSKDGVQLTYTDGVKEVELTPQINADIASGKLNKVTIEVELVKHTAPKKESVKESIKQLEVKRGNLDSNKVVKSKKEGE